MKSDNTSMQAMVVSSSPFGHCGGVFRKITRFLDSAAGAVAFYMIDTLSTDVEKLEGKLQKIEKDFDMHKQLVTIKEDIAYLKGELRR